MRTVAQLSQIKILRNYFLPIGNMRIELDRFSKASMKTNGACIYFRIIYNNRQVNIIKISIKTCYGAIVLVSLAVETNYKK